LSLYCFSYFSAYLVGQLCDVWLFGVIKRLTKGKYLWLRATGSTLISQMLDSFVVSYIAFSYGKKITNQIPATLSEVFNIAITGYSLKFVIAGVITPILYMVRNLLHNKFGFEPLPPDYHED
jgi:queuosine precursor transporter